MHLVDATAIGTMLEVADRAAADAEPQLAELGLTMATAQALWVIRPNEPSPAMKEVAARLYCNASSATFIADRLIDMGYLRRSEAEDDRRVRVLTLTPAGLAARNRAAVILVDSSPISRLSDQEQATLSALLRRSLTLG
jgi:DNA-binding MarR family transcriptional regulator